VFKFSLLIKQIIAKSMINFLNKTERSNIIQKVNSDNNLETEGVGVRSFKRFMCFLKRFMNVPAWMVEEVTKKFTIHVDISRSKESLKVPIKRHHIS
jgi:predicted adenine nucleotide alpha hydrolase (AANH) superfamily ATPase